VPVVGTSLFLAVDRQDQNGDSDADMLEFLNVKTEPLQQQNKKSEQGLKVKHLGTSEMVVILNQKGNQTLHRT
jgi:hypothetical protein